MTLSVPSFSAAATRSSMVPKSSSEVAEADFSSTLTALPLVSEELLLLEPQAAMENASTAAIEPAANLRREIMSFLVVFLRTDNKELNDDD